MKKKTIPNRADWPTMPLSQNNYKPRKRVKVDWEKWDNISCRMNGPTADNLPGFTVHNIKSVTKSNRKLLIKYFRSTLTQLIKVNENRTKK